MSCLSAGVSNHEMKAVSVLIAKLIQVKINFYARRIKSFERNASKNYGNPVYVVLEQKQRQQAESSFFRKQTKWIGRTVDIKN